MGKILFGCGFILLSVVAVGCGGKDDDDDDSGAIPIEGLPARLGGSACKLVYRCCTSAQRAENIFFGSTEAECRSNYSALFALAVPEWNQSIGKGRLRYDANAAAACLSQLDGQACSGATIDPAACEAVFVPLVQSGGACTQQGECVNSACHGGDSTNDIDGMCGAPLANGADCTDDEQCASGYCNGISCDAKVANGATCFTDAECVSDFCDANGVCAVASASACE